MPSSADVLGHLYWNHFEKLHFYFLHEFTLNILKLDWNFGMEPLTTFQIMIKTTVQEEHSLLTGMWIVL